MKRKQRRLPRRLKAALWNVDITQLDPERDADSILAGVLEFGTFEDVRTATRRGAEASSARAGGSILVADSDNHVIRKLEKVNGGWILGDRGRPERRALRVRLR